MAYQKPQMVAKSAPKKSYVAGCPSQTWSGYYPDSCGTDQNCEIYRRQ